MTSLDPNTTQPSLGAGPGSPSRPGSPVVAVVATALRDRMLRQRLVVLVVTALLVTGLVRRQRCMEAAQAAACTTHLPLTVRAVQAAAHRDKPS